MLRVTFYSYKGGVGRTLAVLGVASALAQRGKRVVVVDLDLEAPGIGITESTRPPESATVGERGISDYVLGVQEGIRFGVEDLAYRTNAGSKAEFWCVQAGARRSELGRMLQSIFKKKKDNAFDLFVTELSRSREIAPDFVIFDSRTGRADIASVSLLYLAEVVVFFCGLNEQNVEGLGSLLEELDSLGTLPKRWLPLLAFSPIPHAPKLGVEQPIELTGALWTTTPKLESVVADNLVLQRVFSAVSRFALIRKRAEAAPQQFKAIHLNDTIHGLTYHPRVPLTAELEVGGQIPEMARAYDRLADVLERAAVANRS